MTTLSQEITQQNRAFHPLERSFQREGHGAKPSRGSLAGVDATCFFGKVIK
ncbi:hypothetical protein [Sediminibacillus sp. JSM 1682029]|uniref:hypothetical protein n=1 Tax=Sediminibacillus sp. JSM 1682029 TaxID=3229857 RepID=UPI0035235A34